jgi:hypothetical protein
MCALLMQDAADVRNLSLVYTLAGGMHADLTQNILFDWHHDNSHNNSGFFFYFQSVKN